ncbi:MAG: hypothetical protein PHU27_12085 [Salinivirgaceae bacterium]|nr:hypothetical protein [Salinivirgaceae bacterium]MDD4746526.1 hypothetical protein [Salinivirgaceae bacterium]
MINKVSILPRKYGLFIVQQQLRKVVFYDSDIGLFPNADLLSFEGHTPVLIKK